MNDKTKPPVEISRNAVTKHWQQVLDLGSGEMIPHPVNVPKREPASRFEVLP